MPAEVKKQIQLEIAHVLFIDMSAERYFAGLVPLVLPLIRVLVSALVVSTWSRLSMMTWLEIAAWLAT
jgi:uncharacterized protein (DUF697 family)